MTKMALLSVLLWFAVIIAACDAPQTAEQGATAGKEVTGEPSGDNEIEREEQTQLPDKADADSSGEADVEPMDGKLGEEDESSGEAEAEVQPPAEPEAEPAAKRYYMNKNYDIVPIDPNDNKKVVLLTFDDGPKDKDMLESMVRILNNHQAKAIFFLNGFRIKQKPELLKLLHDNGQVIGNHSWDHILLTKLSNDEIDRQIQDVQKIVLEITGSSPQFFRPPHGAGNEYIKQRVREENMLYMTWSNGSLDWDKKNRDNPAGVIQSVMEQLRPGSNILMHELPWTLDALDELLTKLEAEGYGFVDPHQIDLMGQPHSPNN
jgi:peptidoglycan/xylan/chitin deacetylase (PgdA/CDA1 family)